MKPKHPWAGKTKDRLETRLDDAKPLYTRSEALIEANRCLFCYDAPCIAACPTAIDIPGFIKKIATGNNRGSARKILGANMLGVSCARVCPVEELCAGDCVYNDLNHQPIEIGRLQRYATETALASERAGGGKLFTPAPDTGRKVALVGAGPASLACAAHLALEGVTPVIYERGSLPGGLNTTGVAPYKLQTDDALDEVAWLLSHGAALKENTAVGQQVTFQSLREFYDGIFIGVGLGPDRKLGIPGEEAAWGATALIRAIKNRAGFALPDGTERVLVIGGGNTAIDIARELAMLGCPQVRMLYRRTEAEMSGYRHEMAAARRYGVGFEPSVQPLEVLVEDGAVRGLKATGTAGAGEREWAADMVVVAIGQVKWADVLGVDLATDEQGRIIVDPDSRRTSVPGVYAGGDCINGGKEVVNAAADGREAAFHMLGSWGIEPRLYHVGVRGPAETWPGETGEEASHG